MKVPTELHVLTKQGTDIAPDNSQELQIIRLLMSLAETAHKIRSSFTNWRIIQVG
jgi:hypothetical protein